MGLPTSSTDARGILAQHVLYKSAYLFQSADVCVHQCNVSNDWLVHFNDTGWVKCILDLLRITRVCGFKPGRSRRIFFWPKNPQHAFLRKGSRAVCPMYVADLRHVKNPVITWKLGHRQDLSAISRPISSLANSVFWHLHGVEHLWSWRKALRAVHRGPVA
jgi:hypothetical protein